MTVSVPAQLVYTYSGDGTTTAFSYPVRFTAKAEIVVSLVEDGIETPQTLTTHYTIAGGSWPTGGTVTFLTAPAVGQTVRIYRWTASKQEADLEDKQRNPVAAIELALDRLAMVGQDIGRIALDAEEGLADLDNAVAAAELAQAAAETAEANAGTAETNAETAETNARKWATEDEDVSVDDGVNPEGFSAYHWAKKSESYTGAPAAGTVTDASVANPSKLYNRLNDMVSITDFGAKGDAIRITDAAMTATNPALTSASNPFSIGDVGKYIEVTGAGAAGAVLVTTIAGFTNAGQVILTANAATTVSGAVCTFGTDNKDAINAALTAVDTGAGGELDVPEGTFLTTGTHTSTGFGVKLKGRGALSSTLLAAHSAGSVYRWQRGFGGVYDISIDATDARKLGTGGANYGLRGEAADTAGHTVAASVIRNVRVVNQPSHGFLMRGTIQESVIEGFLLVQNNLGHGAFFESGESALRVNFSQPGLVTATNIWALGNFGHGLVIGHPNDTAIPYRFILINYECEDNALSGSIRYNANQAFIRGDNHTLMDPAFGGSNTTGCLWIAGKDHLLVRPRVIESTSPAFTVGHSANPTTVGIEFQRVRVIASDAQNPLISVASGATNIEVSCDNVGGITSFMTADVPNSVIVTGTNAYHNKKWWAKDYKTKQLTIADDAVGFIEMSAACAGQVDVSISTVDRSGTVGFRIGDVSAYANKIGSALLTGATGTATTPTGTSYTDTHLTAVPMTNANRLYWENRTGSAVTLSYMLKNISNTAAVTSVI